MPNPRRAPYQPLPARVWGEIRRRYEAGASTAALFRAYALPESTFHNRRRREQWQRHPGASGEVVGVSTPPPTMRSASPFDGLLSQEGSAPAPEASATAIRIEPLQPLPAGMPSPFPPDTHGTANTADAISASHLRLASRLRQRVTQLTEMDDLGAGAGGRLSRAVLDAAAALERLQKIERTALGLHERESRPTTNVVIMVPPKLAEDVWLRRARGGSDDEHLVEEQMVGQQIT